MLENGLEHKQTIFDMKKRVKEKRKKRVRNSEKHAEKRRWNKVRFYDVTLEIVVVLFLASLAAVMYYGINSLIAVLCLTADFIAILVFTLGILHYSIKKRSWFISILITALVIAGVLSYAFFLYLGLFTAVLFYFIVLRKEFK